MIMQKIQVLLTARVIFDFEVVLSCALLHISIGTRSEASRGPDTQSRLRAAEILVDVYAAALPPSTAGGHVTYTASVDVGTFVQFACFVSRNMHNDAAMDLEKRTLAEQELAFYRAEVIDKLFCEDKVRCPYERTEAAIDFVIPWVQSRCEATKGKVAFIKIHGT